MVRTVGNVSEKFLSTLRSGRLMFLLVLGTTDTSLIPGITIAGASPELTHYTPPADAEYLLLGECHVIPVPPMTPDGKPTPALISRACIKLLNIPVLVVDAGCRVKPAVPHISLGGSPARDVRTGQALDLDTVKKLFNNAVMLGRTLARLVDLMIIGESIPAGTTTAMTFLIGLGYDAWGRVSSASPVNPKELKIAVAREALARAGLLEKPGDDPFEVVSKVGDPVIVAISGLAYGALQERCKVLLAGGTQMCAIVAFLKHLNIDLSPEHIAVGTTRWIIEDRSADMVRLLGEIWDSYALLVSEFSLANSKYDGLKAYEQGFVKEGVGMGGLLCTCEVRGIPPERILEEVEREYEDMLKLALMSKNM